MSKRDYKWKRFWCPRSGSINLADGGYVYDPEAKWGKICNPDLVTFKYISNLRCLALLGEPGIGKTYLTSGWERNVNQSCQYLRNRLAKFWESASHPLVGG